MDCPSHAQLDGVLVLAYQSVSLLESVATLLEPPSLFVDCMTSTNCSKWTLPVSFSLVGKSGAQKGIMDKGTMATCVGCTLSFLLLLVL